MLKPPISRPFRPHHLLELPFFLLLTAIVCLLPLSAVRSLGRRLGRVGYRLLGSRRRVAMQNLRASLPDRSENELERIARGSFETVAAAFLELLWFPRLTRTRLEKEAVVENAEEVRQELGECGAVVIVSHMAGWEFILQGVNAAFPGRTSVVYKPLSNPITDRFIYDWRSKFGLKWLPMQTAVADTMAEAQRGGVVILAADQSVAKESIRVPFFGRKVPTAKGPAALSLKAGVPIYLCRLRRVADGSYRGDLQLVPSDDIHGYSEANVIELTKRFTKMTEDHILRDPDQWMWTHKRWKHWRPEENTDR
jgi:KDO2-lipid IV(A) lauroyltransferase